MKIKGARVLITGAGRGIGRALALRFAAKGATVVVTDIEKSAAEAVAAEIRAAGRKAEAFTMDVTDPHSVGAAREQINATVGPISILVNNAGTTRGGPFGDVPIEDHLAVTELNVDGTMITTHVFLPDLEAARRGRLVNIASIAGYVGVPFASSYAASKWAAIGFSESIRQELDRRDLGHVGVTVVCPGYVDTGLFDGAEPPKGTRFLTPEKVAKLTVRGVRRGKPYVRTPWLAKVAPPMRGVMPSRTADLITRMFGVGASMIGWTGHEDGESSESS
jgi:short-subunit dehydrogenase